MLACTALVGCTSEDEPVVNNGNQENGKAEAYVSVKLMMTESMGSRATDDGGYDKGVAAEQTISASKSIFLFYDEDGGWVTSGQLIDANSFENETQGNHNHDASYNINDIYDDAYVVLSSPTDDIKKIKQVLTVVNYSDATSLKQLTKDQALAVIAEADEDPANAGFLMSTSVYYSGENLVNTTAITADGDKANIQQTQAGAKANPVKIYIERASAKVQLTYGDNMTTITKAGQEFEVKGSEDGDSDEAGGQEGNDIVIDGVQYPVYISIDGWTVNNVNETSHLVKQLDATWSTTVPFEGWNNAADFRSYWAKGTKYDIQPVANNGLVAYSYNDALAVLSESGLTNDAMYCYEQTVNAPVASKGTANPNVTTMLIAASIKIQKPATTEGGAATTEAVGNIYQYGGVFYTETNYINLILKQIKDKGYGKSVTTDEGTGFGNLEASDLNIESDGTTLSGIKVTVTSTSYIDEKGTAVEATTIDEFIAALDYVKEAEGFAGGKCYYQIPIEHLSSTADAPRYGVVRNHWYKLNISAVKRIGVAVYNPEVVIPQIPEQETAYYLAAELHVLNWHVVNQDVVLD